MSVSYNYTLINDPNSSETKVMGINDSGQIVGYYWNNAGYHTFIDINGTFSTINVPNSYDAFNPLGINGSGQVVGTYPNSALGYTVGFLDTNGTISTINVPSNVPGGSYTEAREINDSGQVIGNYQDSAGFHGFLDTNGTISTITVPGASYTYALGINGSGQVVGDYSDSAGLHGFLDTNGTISTINVPGALSTEAVGINNSGQIVGYYSNNAGLHGFLDTNGTISTIDVLGSSYTLALGINGSGQVFGNYQDSAGSFHGFLDTNGTISTIDVPGASNTYAQGVNDSGQVVGYYVGSTGTHGFLATTTVDPGPNAGTAAGKASLGHAVDLTQAVLNADTVGLSGDTLKLIRTDSSGAHGTVSLVDGKLTYTPTKGGFPSLHPNGTATDSFGYTVQDQLGNTASGTVQVLVTNPRGNGPDRNLVGSGNTTVRGNPGDDTVWLSGYGNTVDGGTGINTVSILSGGKDSFVLHQGGDDVISGFGVSSEDVLDLRTLLAEARLNLGGDTSKLGAYVHVTNTGGAAALTFNPSGTGQGGGGSTVALLQGVGSTITSLSDLTSHSAIRFS